MYHIVTREMVLALETNIYDENEYGEKGGAKHQRCTQVGLHTLRSECGKRVCQCPGLCIFKYVRWILAPARNTLKVSALRYGFGRGC